MLHSKSWQQHWSAEELKKYFGIDSSETELMERRSLVLRSTIGQIGPTFPSQPVLNPHEVWGSIERTEPTQGEKALTCDDEQLVGSASQPRLLVW